MLAGRISIHAFAFFAVVEDESRRAQVAFVRLSVDKLTLEDPAVGPERPALPIWLALTPLAVVVAPVGQLHRHSLVKGVLVLIEVVVRL